MKKKLNGKTATALICAFALSVASAAMALDLGDILKKGAIGIAGGWLVTAISPQMNDFINTITFNKGVAYDGYTKVVPIVSIGDGARIGAAQVGATTQSAIDRTKAVAQLEGEFSSLRATALIPIDSTNPIQRFRRVKGVGVTAIINVKL
ncbi:hypothetical protein [Synergistes jonesii]|uniref:hypothetical protein n=1 Tax=Synergistes jonesii TaxID=2754 RepID=UPI00248DD6A2|nr:hypothetical protein [Synergistes jonesii]